MKRAFLVAGLVAALSVGGWWGWQQMAAPAGPAPLGASRGAGAVPVLAATAARQDLPVALDALGTVQPLAAITIRAQVDGVLTEVLFQEGQAVHAGEVLARIDSRPYQAALDQAIAKRAQDAALLANARLDVQRYQQLSAVAGASRQQLDTAHALVSQLEAEVQFDEAGIANARTQLSFTTLTVPVDGVVGLRLVDQGNLVRAADGTGIVTVAQIRPITVVFNLPQQEIGRVQDAMAAGEVPVAVTPQGRTEPAAGTLLALDNAVDAQTGTVRLRARFANAEGRLWPGAFVAVRLLLRTEHDALTVPLVAIQRGPEGPGAFVLRPDGTVELRPLRLGTLTEGFAQVTAGLSAGDQVVTSGAVRLAPGTRVAVQLAPPPGRAARALAEGAAP